MKKTFVTLATVAALVAAAAPVATTLANNNTYNVESQKANATVAELGREYALAYANAAVAKTNAEGAAADYNAAESALLEIKAEEKRVLAEKQAILDEAQLAWDNATVELLAYEEAGNTVKATEVQNKMDEKLAPAIADATVVLKDTTDKYAEIVKEYQAKFDEAAKVKAEADKALAEAVAAKEAAYNKAINGGLTPEQVAQAESGAEVTPAAPAGNGAAANNGGAAAPAGNGAAANNGKAAAKTVAAAKTETGAKTLPKTSAAK
ncbi:TPA: hypothetical protein ACGPAJ_000085 [Streptococcus suis]